MSDPVDSSGQFVTVPGGQVFVSIWTPPQPRAATAVVLLHDSLGCVALWRGFPALLAARLGRPVIAYDRLGFGQSSPRTQLPSLRFIAEEGEIYLPLIAEALGIRKVILFGHSVGGCMAVLWAGMLGTDCEAVVTESAQAFVEERTREGVRRGRQEFADPAKLLKLERFHGPKAAWAVRAWSEVWLSPQFADWSLERDLPKLRCPLLAIHGDRDEYGSVRFPEMICQLAGGPADQLIIPDCGHVPHREKPAVVLAAVGQFLPEPSLSPG
jgi:pimeloyl-ACP methyl ester carboxylesterase